MNIENITINGGKQTFSRLRSTSSILVSHKAGSEVLIIECDDRKKATDEAITGAVARFYGRLYGEALVSVKMDSIGYGQTDIVVKVVGQDDTVLRWTFLSSISI